MYVSLVSLEDVYMELYGIKNPEPGEVSETSKALINQRKKLKMQFQANLKKKLILYESNEEVRRLMLLRAFRNAFPLFYGNVLFEDFTKQTNTLEEVLKIAKWYILRMRADYHNYHYFNDCVRILLRKEGYNYDEMDQILTSDDYIAINPWSWRKTFYQLFEEPFLEVDMRTTLNPTMRHRILYVAECVVRGQSFFDSRSILVPFDYRTIKHHYQFNTQLEETMKNWTRVLSARRPAIQCI
jgi:hypothetical protein